MYFLSKVRILFITFLITKRSIIGTQAYKELVTIMKDQKFNPEHLMHNLQPLTKIRKKLPLMNIRKTLVNISDRKTQTKVMSIKPAYTFSIVQYLERILSNPAICKRMYFGPAILTENRIEFWHGDLWQESPLFGSSSITIRNSGKL